MRNSLIAVQHSSRPQDVLELPATTESLVERHIGCELFGQERDVVELRGVEVTLYKALGGGW